MSDDTQQAIAPATRAEWRAMLQEAANRIMLSKPRINRAGNLAGALIACAGTRPYDHSAVTHRPNDTGRHIVYLADPSTAKELAEQLRNLNLPGVADITVEPGEEGKRSQLILTPFPLPPKN